MVVSAAKSWFYIGLGESLNLGRKQELGLFYQQIKISYVYKIASATLPTYVTHTHKCFNSCIVNNMKGDEEDVTVAPYFGSTTFSLFVNFSSFPLFQK